MNSKRVRRLRRSQDQIDCLLAAFDREGISAQKFARQQGIPPASIATWLRRRKAQTPQAPKWIELIPPVGRAASPGVCIELTDGVRVHWASNIPAGAVAELISLLRRP